MAQSSILGRIGQLSAPTSTRSSTVPRIRRRCSTSWSATSPTTSPRPRRPSPRRSATCGCSRTTPGGPGGSRRVAGQGEGGLAPRRRAARGRATPPRPTGSTSWPRSPSAGRSASRARPRTLETQVASQTELTDKLKDGLNKLRVKREELVQKRDELVSRAKMAQAQSAGPGERCRACPSWIRPASCPVRGAHPPPGGPGPWHGGGRRVVARGAVRVARVGR